jgi:hypothetical protein
LEPRLLETLVVETARGIRAQLSSHSHLNAGKIALAVGKASGSHGT